MSTIGYRIKLVSDSEMHVDQIDDAKHDMVVDAYDVDAQTMKIRITI